MFSGLANLLPPFLSTYDLCQQTVHSDRMAPAMKVRGYAARRSDSAGASGDFPFAAPIFLYKHSVVMNSAVRKFNLNSLLRQETAASFPVQQKSAKSRFMKLLGWNDAPVLFTSLNKVHIIAQFLNTNNSAASSSIDRLHIDGGEFVK
ncbi:hypothetical protein D1872_261620 [compost metagenome]